jgi:hypothetical protein
MPIVAGAAFLIFPMTYTPPPKHHSGIPATIAYGLGKMHTISSEAAVLGRFHFPSRFALS